MRTIAQKYRDEGIQIGKEKGKLEGKLEGERARSISIAKAMLDKGYPIEDIMLITDLSRSSIKEIE